MKSLDFIQLLTVFRRSREPAKAPGGPAPHSSMSPHIATIPLFLPSDDEEEPSALTKPPAKNHKPNQPQHAPSFAAAFKPVVLQRLAVGGVPVNQASAPKVATRRNATTPPQSQDLDAQLSEFFNRRRPQPYVEIPPRTRPKSSKSWFNFSL